MEASKKNKKTHNIEDENLVLSRVESDLKDLKGLESVDKNSFKSPEVLGNLTELSSFFINNPNLLDFLKDGAEQEAKLRESGEEVPDNLAILNEKISNLEKNLGLNREDILAVFKSYDEKILLEARSEVLQAKKTIKIGQMNMPVSTLIKIPVYMGTTILASFTAGLGGVAGVAIVRSVEKYISDKKDKKNIDLEANKKRRAFDKKDLAKNISSSLFIKKMEKEDKNFKEDFLMNKTEEEKVKIITDFVDVKYGYIDRDVKKSLITKYKVQLELENNQTKKERASKINLPGIVKRFGNLLKKDFSDSSESKAIRAIITSGVIMTTGRIAREIPVLKNILGAYMGWNLGGLAANIFIKKEKPLAFNEQNLIEGLEVVKNSFKSFKKSSLNKSGEDSNYIELFDELLYDVKGLEKYRAQASLEIEKNFLKDTNPEKYLAIKENIDEASNYIHLIKARFQAVDFNNKKEKILIEERNLSDINKTKFNLAKLGGVVIGVLTPSVLGLIMEGTHSASASSATEAPSTESSVNTGPENVSTEVGDEIEPYSEGSQAETELNSLETKIVEKINEIIGDPQKSVVLESGDGVSKIFDGNMGSDYKVNFIDEQTGDVFEGIAESKVVHPGDEIILGEDGGVSVICKQGVVDNPKFSSDYLSEENIALEKMPTLDLKEMEISSDINPIDNITEAPALAESEGLTGPSSPEGLENIETDFIDDPTAGRLVINESGKLVLEDSAGNVMSGNSSAEIADSGVNNLNEAEATSVEDNDLSALKNSKTEDVELESIVDPAAGRLVFDENGKLVLEGMASNDMLGESSPDLNIETADSLVENDIVSDISEVDTPLTETPISPATEAGDITSVNDPSLLEDSMAPSGNEVDPNLAEASSSSTEVFLEDVGNLNESFNTPENFKDVLGKDFTDLKIIEKVDSFGSKLGFSLSDPVTGNSVDISFPRAGGIRLEEGLGGQSFGGLREGFGDSFNEEKSLIIGTEDNGSFSIEDFRNGIRQILE